MNSTRDPEHSSQGVLHTAARVGNSAMVELALKAGADVRTLDNEGHSAIFVAVSRGNPRSFFSLARAGADLYGREFRGLTLLHIAAYHCDFVDSDATAILRFLATPWRDGGAGLNVDDVANRIRASPLALAVARQRFLAARLLLDSGANPNSLSDFRQPDDEEGEAGIPREEIPLSRFLRSLGARAMREEAANHRRREIGAAAAAEEAVPAPPPFSYDWELLDVLIDRSDLEITDRRSGKGLIASALEAASRLRRLLPFQERVVRRVALLAKAATYLEQKRRTVNNNNNIKKKRSGLLEYLRGSPAAREYTKLCEEELDAAGRVSLFEGVEEGTKFATARDFLLERRPKMLARLGSGYERLLLRLSETTTTATTTTTTTEESLSKSLPIYGSESIKRLRLATRLAKAREEAVFALGRCLPPVISRCDLVLDKIIDLLPAKHLRQLMRAVRMEEREKKK